MFGTLHGGKRVITASPFEPNHMLKIINKFNVTTTIITPVLLAKLLSCERGELLNDSMKVLCIAGLPLLSKLMYGRAKLFFPNCEVFHTYGCSEGGFLSMNSSKIKCESVGQLYGNVDIKESVNFSNLVNVNVNYSSTDFRRQWQSFRS